MFIPTCILSHALLNLFTNRFNCGITISGVICISKDGSLTTEVDLHSPLLHSAPPQLRIEGDS